MLGKNMFACLRDTVAGIDAKRRNPRWSAARSGPYPPLDPTGGITESQRRLDFNSVGTVNTPLVVASPRAEMVQQEAGM